MAVYYWVAENKEGKSIGIVTSSEYGLTGEQEDMLERRGWDLIGLPPPDSLEDFFLNLQRDLVQLGDIQE